ncbi:MAG TPA: carboxylesterase family protein [Rhizomicrobium sp.]|jgi:para-nitrobenzyl esterase|nr:carboxylesterase family protein [Rhizomicrobium sp.]
MSPFRHLVLAAAVCAAASSPSWAGPAPKVDAPAGSLEGKMDGAIRVFEAIPYAAPPVGALRWTPPRPMPRWAGVKTATAYGPECVQPKGALSSIYASDPAPMSEDCLTLNIWAPADARNAPVFFWIYGGALWGGSNRDPLYDGARLAQRGVIVVTINYRVGVLGWLAHPELSAESPLDISGNYGLLDQIAALQWVKANIGAFGGDPANVTIAGESAGGLSVMYLMASPGARGLFAKAIAESAYMISTPALKEAANGTPSAEDSGSQLAAALHAPNIAALRAMNAETLTLSAAAHGFAPFGAVDGHVLPGQLVDVFDKGEQAPVPILAGFNSGEIRSLTILAPPTPASRAAYEQAIFSHYGDLAGPFLRLYPSSNMRESILATTRDALYGWTAERLVRKQAAIGQPSFLYYFDHGYPAADDANLHGFHASELPFVFGTMDRTGPLWPKIPATPAEAQLSDAMIGYWTSFARAGHPQAKNQPDWPAFEPGDAYMDFTGAPHPADHLLPGMYALQEQAVCRRRASGDEPWNWNVGIISPSLPSQKERCP